MTTQKINNRTSNDKIIEALSLDKTLSIIEDLNTAVMELSATFSAKKSLAPVVFEFDTTDEIPLSPLKFIREPAYPTGKRLDGHPKAKQKSLNPCAVTVTDWKGLLLSEKFIHEKFVGSPENTISTEVESLCPSPVKVVKMRPGLFSHPPSTPEKSSKKQAVVDNSSFESAGRRGSKSQQHKIATHPYSPMGPGHS